MRPASSLEDGRWWWWWLDGGGGEFNKVLYGADVQPLDLIMPFLPDIFGRKAIVYFSFENAATLKFLKKTACLC